MEYIKHLKIFELITQKYNETTAEYDTYKEIGYFLNDDNINEKINQAVALLDADDINPSASRIWFTNEEKTKLSNIDSVIDNKIGSAVEGLSWKESVSTYADIAIEYPTPQEGWTVSVDDTNRVYRYDSATGTWINLFSSGSSNLASATLDGLMSKELFSKLEGIAFNANNYIHPATHSADMITESVTRKWFTQVDKDKLDNIAAGANVNVQADWNATSGDAFIRNKPTSLTPKQNNTDWNLITDYTGFNFSSENSPYNQVAGGLILGHAITNSFYQQIVARNNRMFLRPFENSNFGEWVEVYHTGNLNWSTLLDKPEIVDEIPEYVEEQILNIKYATENIVSQISPNQKENIIFKEQTLENAVTSTFMYDEEDVYQRIILKDTSTKPIAVYMTERFSEIYFNSFGINIETDTLVYGAYIRNINDFDINVRIRNWNIDGTYTKIKNYLLKPDVWTWVDSYASYNNNIYPPINIDVVEQNANIDVKKMFVGKGNKIDNFIYSLEDQRLLTNEYINFDNSNLIINSNTAYFETNIEDELTYYNQNRIFAEQLGGGNLTQQISKVEEFGFKDANRYILNCESTTSNTNRCVFRFFKSTDANQSYSTSIYFKNNGTSDLEILPNLNSYSQIVKPGESKHLKFENFKILVDNGLNLIIRSVDDNLTVDFTWAKIKVEKSTICTAYNLSEFESNIIEQENLYNFYQKNVKDYTTPSNISLDLLYDIFDDKYFRVNVNSTSSEKTYITDKYVPTFEYLKTKGIENNQNLYVGVWVRHQHTEAIQMCVRFGDYLSNIDRYFNYQWIEPNVWTFIVSTETKLDGAHNRQIYIYVNDTYKNVGFDFKNPMIVKGNNILGYKKSNTDIINQNNDRLISCTENVLNQEDIIIGNMSGFVTSIEKNDDYYTLIPSENSNIKSFVNIPSGVNLISNFGFTETDDCICGFYIKHENSSELKISLKSSRYESETERTHYIQPNIWTFIQAFPSKLSPSANTILFETHQKDVIINIKKFVFGRGNNLSNFILSEEDKLKKYNNFSIGSVNLMNNPNSIDFGDSYNSSILTKSKVTEFGFTDANKIVTSGGTSTIKTIFQFNNFTTGVDKLTKSYSLSFYFKNNGLKSLTLNRHYDNVDFVVAAGESIFFKWESIKPNTSIGNFQVEVMTEFVSDSADFTWSRFMFEEGDKCTTYYDPSLKIDGISEKKYNSIDILNITKDIIFEKFVESSNKLYTTGVISQNILENIFICFDKETLNDAFSTAKNFLSVDSSSFNNLKLIITKDSQIYSNKIYANEFNVRKSVRNDINGIKLNNMGIEYIDSDFNNSINFQIGNAKTVNRYGIETNPGLFIERNFNSYQPYQSPVMVVKGQSDIPGIVFGCMVSATANNFKTKWGPLSIYAEINRIAIGLYELVIPKIHKNLIPIVSAHNTELYGLRTNYFVSTEDYTSNAYDDETYVVMIKTNFYDSSTGNFEPRNDIDFNIMLLGNNYFDTI